MLIREHPSTDSCHRSCDLYNHYQVPIQWLWVDHPADELVQLTTSYTSAVKNMISQFISSISSNSSIDKDRGRTCEMRVHFIMVSLRPFRQFCQVPSKFFRCLSTSGDLTLQKILVLLLHHPHLNGWQRVHHSTASI